MPSYLRSCQLPSTAATSQNLTGCHEAESEVSRMVARTLLLFDYFDGHLRHRSIQRETAIDWNMKYTTLAAERK